jgi:hypothetical protein
MSFFLQNIEKIKDNWNTNPFLLSKFQENDLDLPTANKLVRYFSGVFEQGQWIAPIPSNINASHVDSKGIHHQHFGVDIDSARNLYLQGYTLCSGDLSPYIAQLNSIKNVAGDLFSFPESIAITSYLSPKESIGVLHFDRQHNFFMQKEGVKRWLVSKNAAVKNPYDNFVYTGVPQTFFSDLKNRGYTIRLPSECGKLSFDLHPGEVLYVPPGHYHSPETLTNFSLHYTLTIEPVCFWKDVNQLLFSELLSNNENFMKDYRFLNKSEKLSLMEKCFESIRISKIKNSL